MVLWREVRRPTSKTQQGGGKEKEWLERRAHISDRFVETLISCLTPKAFPWLLVAFVPFVGSPLDRNLWRWGRIGKGASEVLRG